MSRGVAGGMSRDVTGGMSRDVTGDMSRDVAGDMSLKIFLFACRAQQEMLGPSGTTCKHGEQL